MTSVHLQDGKRLFVALLALGLVLRVAVLSQTETLGTPIVDEQHYTRIAGSLLSGDGFGWGPGRPTSIRPPAYPAFVAAVWAVAGEGNLQAVRLAQMGLSAATAWLVFLVGRDAFTSRVGSAAAAVVWLYPSFIFFNVTILTETLYTFLLVLFVLLTIRLVKRPAAPLAVGVGLALGFACLTRSSLWPLPLVLCPLLVIAVEAPVARRVAMAALVFVGYAIVIAPWATRNTRLQGVVTIVDTMGGLNLRMGNYEHTPEDRMWDAVAVEGERGWAYALRLEHPGESLTEGQKDKWARRKAIEYIVANPGTTLRRSLIRFGDFWGLEREYAAGIATGIFDPPRWFAMLSSLAVVLAYAAVAVAGIGGIWLAPAPGWTVNVALLLPAVAIMGTHTLVFGHSRYHAPLIPFLALYAASLLTSGALRIGERPWLFAGAAASACVLVAIWSRQVLLVDAGRIQGFFTHVR
jgi:4-amino-4-deoxy-L-arabinose transferase-like glycosyltransferase